ncbi:hypothetical protein [Halorarius halobius]|uniref:hypothetical protein n=1 Tax=Halorarius halobius TaxID=2962671 RepID=UPI0020CF8EC9|nr:hypothetical protein [Halorarius halobius]
MQSSPPPIRFSGRRRAASLVVVLLVALPLVAPAVASPQPDAACDVCGQKFERGAEELGVSVNVTHSTADVYLDGGGAATWVVRNRLTPDSAARLRGNPERVDAVAAAAFETYPEGPVENPTGLTATLSNRTVTIRYDHDAPTDRTAGVTLVEYFDTDGYDYWYVVNADRLTVVAPEGTRVTNDPAEATVDGRNVTWRGGSEELWSGPSLTDGEARVVYADADASLPGVRTTAALWADVLPIYLDNIRTFLVPTALAFGLLAAGGLTVARYGGSRVDPETAGRAVAGLGVAATLAALVGGVVWESTNNAAALVGLTGLAVLLGGVAVVRPRWLRTARGAALTGAAAALGCAGVATLGSWVTLAGPVPATAGGLVSWWTFLLPVALSPAAGLLVAQGRPVAGWGLLVAALVVAGAVFLPVATRPFGLLLFAMFAGAALAAVAATPLATLGASFARD